MRRGFNVLAVAVAMCGFLPVGSLLAATATATRDARRVGQEQQDVSRAQKKARQTREASDQATEALRRAEAAQTKAEEKLKQSLASAGKAQSERLGLPNLYAERDRLRAEIAKRQDAIVHELKTRADYQEKSTAAEAANKRLGELSSDRTLSDEQRYRLISELTPITKRPMEARNREFESDSKLKELNQQFHAADQKAGRLQKELVKAIEADVAVVQARAELKTAGNGLDKAKKDVKEAEKENAIAQANLQQENRQLEQAKAKKAADNRLRNQRR